MMPTVTMDGNFKDHELKTSFAVPTQGKCILDELHNMRCNGILIDVIIKVDGTEFPGHRAVFAAISPYFKAMFSYGLRESHERTVEIQGVASDVMQTIVDYVYTGRCFFTKQNAGDVMMTADLFQMLALKNAAIDFLVNNLDKRNCLLIRKIAEVHSCTGLFLEATKYSRKYFEDIVLEDYFLSMDVTDVVDYLTDDELAVDKEDIVYDAAIRWIKHGSDRHHYMPFVLKAVRLPFISPLYLKRHVAQEPLVKNSGCCVKQVVNARQFHVSGLFSHNCDNSQRRPRHHASKEVLIIFGGETRVGNYHECICDINYYNPDIKKWQAFASFSDATRSTQAFCAVSLGYDIYVTGGTLNNKAVAEVNVFNSYMNKWCRVSSMHQPRYHHSSAVVNSDIFVVGGTDGTRCLDHVEKIVPAENKWIPIEPMVHSVKCPATASHDMKLYVLGGFTDRYTICQSIQVYDTVCANWMAISCPAIDYTCAKAIPLAQKIYLLGGCSKTVKVYDPKTDVVRKVADMITKRDNCGAAAVGEKIYVTGGISESNGASLDTAECYCPVLDKWETITTMPKRLYRHGCVSMRIPVYRTDGVGRRIDKASEHGPNPPDAL